MADGDLRASDAFKLIMGRESSGPQETLEFVTAFNEAAVLAGLPQSEWTPNGVKIPKKALDFILWQYDSNTDFVKAALPLQIPTDKKTNKLVVEPFEFAAKVRSAIQSTAQQRFEGAKAVRESLVTPLQEPPLTDAEVGVLDATAFAAAQKYRNEHRDTAHPNGVYPSLPTLFQEMAAPGAQLSRADAERAYFDALRASGMWPPKTPEFQEELIKRFGDIWDAVGRGDLGDISDAAAFTQLIGENLPEPEAEFTAKNKEKSLIKEKFNDAWQRLLSTKGIDVPAELQDSVKALLGKAFVDAAFQNPATTKAESVIKGGFQSAIKKAQTQRQEGFREDAFAQLVAEGDYDRAARLIGPPPSPPAPSLTEQRLQEFFATEEGQEFKPEDYDIDATRRRTAALADFPTFANAAVISDVELSRRSFEPVLSEAIGRQDPGYQKFLRERFPERLPEKQVIGLRGALQQRPEDFAQFIGREFERLRPEFERSQQQQQRQALTEEERQSRSFRSSLFTRYR